MHPHLHARKLPRLIDRSMQDCPPKEAVLSETATFRAGFPRQLKKAWSPIPQVPPLSRWAYLQRPGFLTAAHTHPHPGGFQSNYPSSREKLSFCSHSEGSLKCWKVKEETSPAFSQWKQMLNHAPFLLSLQGQKNMCSKGQTFLSAESIFLYLKVSVSNEKKKIRSHFPPPPLSTHTRFPT